MTNIPSEQSVAALRRLAARGTAWNYAGSAVSLCAQVGYTALTARLIDPAGFGAYATAQAMVALVGYFSLTTIGAAVVRRADAPRELTGSAIAVSVGVAFPAAVLVLALAPLWAAIWHAPESVQTIRVFSGFIMCTTLAVVPLALLRRALRFRTAALLEAGTQVAGMVAGASIAVATKSPVALALGQTVAMALLLIGSAFFARRDLGLSASRTEIRYVLGFSSQVSGQNLVYYVVYTAPAWAISYFAGQSALGFYSRAYLVVSLPLTHLAFGLTKSLYPLYGRLQGDMAAVRDLLTTTLRAVVMWTWPAFAAVAGAAPYLVETLFGPGWGPTARVLPLIALFGAFNLPSTLLSNSAEAFRWMRFVWTVQASWLVCLVALLLGGGASGRLVVYMAAAAAVSQVVAHAAQLVYFGRVGALDLAGVAPAYLAAAGVGAAVFLIARALDSLLAGMASLERLPLEVAALCLVAAALPVVSYLRPRRATISRQPEPFLREAAGARELEAPVP